MANFYHVSRLGPCPSKVYQQLMRTLCLEQETLSNNFLNGVLNQLNWAFSEFVGILQEVNVRSGAKFEFAKFLYSEFCA